MIIVAGYMHVDPTDRDRFVHEFSEFVQQTRQAAGCLDFSISADSVEPSRINTFELWDAPANLDAFRAEANPPDTGIAFHNGWMQEYVIEYARAPFSDKGQS